MYTSPLRQQYEAKLSQILRQRGPFKSSKMLQAYATFSTMVLCSDVPSEAYTTVCEDYPDCRNALLRISNQQLASIQSKDIQNFVKISIWDFLTYVTPDIVCNVAALRVAFEQYSTEHATDTMYLLHHIIAIKLNAYQEIPTGESGESDSDPLTAIYRHYKQNQQCPLPIGAFRDFYGAINLHQLDPDELTVNTLGRPKKKLDTLLNILFTELQLTRAQSIQMVRDFFCYGLQATQIGTNQELYPFIQNKKMPERIKLIQKALQLIGKFPPIVLLCAISIRKKYGAASEERKTEADIIENDIMLENGLVYSFFFSETVHDADTDLLILFPTLHFVNKVLWSGNLTNRRITFVFQDECISQILTYQASKPNYAPEINSNIRFISYEQWCSKAVYPVTGYSNVLLFGTRLPLTERDEFLSILSEQCMIDASMLVLDASQHIEGGYIRSFDNEKIVIQKIGLIPQGINNGTRPRRKALLRCAVNPCDVTAAQAAAVQLQTYTLNTVLQYQALSPMHEDPVSVSRGDLQESTQTLRQQFSREITLRKAPGQERNPAFSHEITPDIVVWSSKTYPTGNNSRPRLEAYVCEPTPADKVNSASIDRGKRISSTIKHKTAVADEDVLDWLENVYPFSVVHPKPAKSDKDTVPAVISIQDEIISHYTKFLSGENIALKTLWYLYPSLADHFSKSDYEIFSEMVKTLIGEQRVCDLTAELCEYLLTKQYPELTPNSLWARFNMISTALDQAVILGYCPSNKLREALRQAKVRDKLFAQVRNALVKKHFTRGEYQKAYDFAMQRIEQGNHLFLGVLIRLITGLESKIVCALRWCDLIYSEEYDVYSIIIARKMLDDGTFEGFYDNEDYLVFPIPDRLRKVILDTRSKYPDVSDKQLILGSLQPHGEDSTYISPTTLNKLTREMVLSLGIDEHIVVLPHQGEQTKETDLNKYNGDLMRQNFRFWATEAGKLNADELSYLLRNKPASTLGCYYCDFLNEASQLMLQVKLNRIDAAIHGAPAKAQSQPERIEANYVIHADSNEGAKQSLLVELNNLTAAELEVEVRINSPYGVTYEVIPSRKEAKV